jgi:hypothetical protein
LEPVVWQPAGNGTRISRLLGCIDHSERVSVLAGEKIADDGLAIWGDQLAVRNVAPQHSSRRDWLNDGVSAARALGVKPASGRIFVREKKPSMLKIPPAPDHDHAPASAG